MLSPALPVPQTYDYRRSYDWNYANAPTLTGKRFVAPLAGQSDFCGIPVNSPLGMPAGPLLNSAWILHYASLGFDVLTYKTVRSQERACYDLPNLLPVSAEQLTGNTDSVQPAESIDRTRSWAISFGMPSKEPAIWRGDIEVARRGLAAGQVLVVSVVASPKSDSTLEAIADDFAQCSRWAKEAGAQVVEANLSCPNVCTSEGQLYTSPEASRLVAQAIRDAVGNTPIVLKIGLFGATIDAEAFVDSVANYVDALSTTNSISATVREGDQLWFDGLPRGIGGVCIRERCLAEVSILGGIISRKALPLRLIGVGGIATAEDVKLRLAAGAHHVQIASAAMLDPTLGLRIREDLSAHSESTKVVKTSEPAKNLQYLAP